MEQIRVRHLDGDRFEIAARGHVVIADQPTTEGGTDTGATPTELFVAGLAACVAHYARRYLRRHGLPTEGLAVTAGYELTSRPARVGVMQLLLHLPAAVPEERREPLLAVASHCTIHNTLIDPPLVEVRLAPADPSLDAPLEAIGGH